MSETPLPEESAPESPEEATTENVAEPETGPVNEAELSPEEQIEQLKAAATQAAERELRALAEYENLRRRVSRDLEENRKFAALPIIRDLLPAIDNLNLAIDSASKSPETQGVAEGVKLVQTELFNVLANHHCQPIEALGQPFDPNLHEALGQQPSDEYEAGLVMLEVRPGFQVHGRVVRPSQVFVSTGPKS